MTWAPNPAFCECCRQPTPDCRVMRELRLYRTPEGRKQLLAEYHELLRNRAAEGPQLGAEWRHAQKAGCPADALLALRGQVRDTKSMDAAKRFCREGRGVMTFLTLLGTPGIGKTVAASYVVVDFCRSWPWNEQPTGGSVEPVLYVQAAGLARLSSFEANDRAHLEALKDCRLLVLEDAGEEATEFGKGVLVELLMYRDAKKRRTVLCTNVTGNAFTARYGEAVTSRLKAAGIVPNLQNEPSLRRRAA